MRTVFLSIFLVFSSILNSQSISLLTDNSISKNEEYNLYFRNEEYKNHQRSIKLISNNLLTVGSKYRDSKICLIYQDDDLYKKKKKLKSTLLMTAGISYIGSIIFGGIAFSPGSGENRKGMDSNTALKTSAILGLVGTSMIVISINID